MWDKRHQKQSFVRSGYMTLNDGTLRDNHYGGRSWSQSAESYLSGKSARAHGFHINATTFFPSTDFNRWYGFSVRCLVILIGINTMGASGCIV